MHVLWNPPEDVGAQRVPRLVTVKPGRSLLCVFLGSRNDAVSAHVHWVYRQRKSVPCSGDNCPMCPRPKIFKAFLPVLQCSTQLQMSSGKWEIEKLEKWKRENVWSRKVLEVPSSGRSILTKIESGKGFIIERLGEHKNAEVMFTILDFKMDGIEDKIFDPRPTMLRAWGIG